MLNEAMLEELVKTIEFLSKKGLAPATNGNISARIDDKSFVIGGAKKDKSAFTKYDLVVCDFESNVLSGDALACATTHLHALIYQLSPYTNSILHSHSKPIHVLSRLHQVENKIDLQGKTVIIFENNASIADDIKLRWSEIIKANTFIVQGLGLFSFGLTLFDAKQLIEECEFLADCELTYQLAKKRI